MWSSAKVTAEGTAVSAQWYRSHWQLPSRLVAQTHYLQNKSLTFQCTLQYRSNVANALVAQIVRPSACLFFFICRAIVRVLYICKIPRHIQNIITTKKNHVYMCFQLLKKNSGTRHRKPFIIEWIYKRTTNFIHLYMRSVCFKWKLNLSDTLSPNKSRVV